MFSSNSSQRAASEGSLTIVVPRSTRIIDKFEPEAQASSSHPLEYTRMIDLVKNPGYLQSCIKAQIKVRFYGITYSLESYDDIAN